MDWIEISSLILNFVLGSSLVVTLATLRSTRREAAARAEKVRTEVSENEIRNVEAAIKIWRDMAESMAERHSALMVEVENLRKEIGRLKTVSNKIVRLLDRISPENLLETVEKIKSEIADETNNLSDDNSITAPILQGNSTNE